MRNYDSYEAKDKFNNLKRFVKAYQENLIPDFMDCRKEDILYFIDEELDRLEKFKQMYEKLRKEVEEQVEEI